MPAAARDVAVTKPRKVATLRSPEAEPMESASVAAAPAAAPVAGSDTGATELGQRAASLIERYAAMIRGQLEAQKSYPALARRLGKQGTVVVRFTLQRDGRVLKAEILSPSEHPVLNDAAKKLVENVASFAPFPAEITAGSADFLVPIEYQL